MYVKKSKQICSKSLAKSRTRKAIGLAIATAGALVMSACGSSTAETPSVFGEADIIDNWGFSASADIVNNVPDRCPSGISAAATPPCHLVAVGIFSFRAEGKCSLNVRMGVDGLTLPPHESGAAVSTDAEGGACDYIVREDGTGSIKENFPGNPLVTLDFVITNHKEEVRFIRRDVVMATGVMTRQ